jgi:hypothetical protein
LDGIPPKFENENLSEKFVGRIFLQNRSQVAERAQLVERRLAPALGLGRVQCLVVQAVLHAHPVALLEGQAQQVDLVGRVTVALLRREPEGSFFKTRDQVYFQTKYPNLGVFWRALFYFLE